MGSLSLCAKITNYAMRQYLRFQISILNSWREVVYGEGVTVGRYCVRLTPPNPELAQQILFISVVLTGVSQDQHNPPLIISLPLSPATPPILRIIGNGGL